MSDSNLIPLQRLGEDCAYTFKGLHKTADWLEVQYKLYLAIPILFSIVALGFDEEISSLWLKGFAVASLAFTMLALLGQHRFEKVGTYRRLADKVKSIYDRAEVAYHDQDKAKHAEVRSEWERLKPALSQHNISWMGRWRSKRVIKQEMNLQWLSGYYNEE